jgi:uncharacterized protein
MNETPTTLQSLRIEVREPGRRTGHSKHLIAVVSAPEGMSIPVIGVPAGEQIDLDLMLQAVGEGILVTGTAVVPIAGDCSRCLEPIEFDDEVEMTALFAYPPTDARGRVIAREEDDEDADEQLWVDGDHIDLEAPLRDAVVLGLPLAPLCDPDCPGLCVECGASLRAEPDHSHEAVDPRWQGLATLLPPVDTDSQP